MFRKKNIFHIENLLFILFIFLIFIVLYQIVARYIPSIPRALWTEEVSRSVFIGLVLFSAVFGCYEQMHFKFEYFYSKIPKKHLGFINLLLNIFYIVVTFFLTKAALNFFIFGLAKTSLVTGLSYGWSYIAVLIGFSLMFVYYVIVFFSTIVNAIKNKRKIS